MPISKMSAFTHNMLWYLTARCSSVSDESVVRWILAIVITENIIISGCWERISLSYDNMENST